MAPTNITVAMPEQVMSLQSAPTAASVIFAHRVHALHLSRADVASVIAIAAVTCILTSLLLVVVIRYFCCAKRRAKCMECRDDRGLAIAEKAAAKAAVEAAAKRKAMIDKINAETDAKLRLRMSRTSIGLRAVNGSFGTFHDRSSYNPDALHPGIIQPPLHAHIKPSSRIKRGPQPPIIPPHLAIRPRDESIWLGPQYCSPLWPPGAS